MLLKLIKYDFKSMLRSFVPLWIAFIAVSIINRFTGSFTSLNDGLLLNLMTGVSMFLYVILMMAINVIGLVLIIQRFYSGLLGDEGYLMFTLPVRPWQHVCSKGITATALITVNGLISIGSVFILEDSRIILDALSKGLESIERSGFGAGLFIILIALLALATVIKSIFQIYAAMALGHLASRHRIIWSVGAYIGISIALSILGSILIAVVAASTLPDWLTSSIGSVIGSGDAVGLAWTVFGVAMGLTLIQLAAFYVTTERILATKLNLE